MPKFVVRWYEDRNELWEATVEAENKKAIDWNEVDNTAMVVGEKSNGRYQMSIEEVPERKIRRLSHARR
jgi:hypothetical protein